MTQDTAYRDAKNFFQVFEPKGEVISGVKVPGSVHLLGEINDFNKGKVVSANINKDSFILAQKRRENDRSVQFYSLKYDEKIRMSLNEPESKEEHGWANFMSSTLFMLEGTSRKVNGMNVFINNQIPDQFDANSIESLEVGVALIASRFSDWEIKGVEIAEACSEGEKKFMGRNKSFAKYLPSIFGKKGMVTYFDAAELKEENVEAGLDGLVFMILSSGLKKKAIEEKMKGVYAELEESMKIMKRNGAAFDSLHALTMEQFDDYRGKLSISQRKKCAFFISENERAQKAKEALAAKKVEEFISILNESQKNIKNRLDLVEEENEILIDMIQDMPEIKAVRMLNMGLDGTVITILEKDRLEAVQTKIKKTFLTRTGLDLITEVFDLNNQIEDIDINVAEFKK